MKVQRNQKSKRYMVVSGISMWLVLNPRRKGILLLISCHFCHRPSRRQRSLIMYCPPLAVQEPEIHGSFDVTIQVLESSKVGSLRVVTKPYWQQTWYQGAIDRESFSLPTICWYLVAFTGGAFMSLSKDRFCILGCGLGCNLEAWHPEAFAGHSYVE